MKERRRSRLERAQRAELARRESARSHLARRRERGRPERPVRAPAPWLACLVLVGSGAAGSLLGPSLVAAAVRARDDAPPAVRAIHVRGAERIAPEEVARATGVAPGSGRVDAAAVASQLEEHPRVARARAVWLPHGALVVEISERVARAVLAGGEGDGAVAVDGSGRPFDAATPEERASLPHIVAGEPFPSGERSGTLAEAVRLARLAARRGLAPSRIEVAAPGDPEGFSVRLPEVEARVVLGRDDLDARLSVLARLLALSPPELATAEHVDLRFAGQAVLRRKPPW